MTPQSHRDLLTDKLYVTVILRLLLGKHGRLEQGEVVDLDGNPRGRFKVWGGLSTTLRKWLESRDSVDASMEDRL